MRGRIEQTGFPLSREGPEQLRLIPRLIEKPDDLLIGNLLKSLVTLANSMERFRGIQNNHAIGLLIQTTDRVGGTRRHGDDSLQRMFCAQRLQARQHRGACCNAVIRQYHDFILQGRRG